MGLSHTVECDNQCGQEEAITVGAYGPVLPEGWDSWTLISSLHPDVGLTFYRCKTCRANVLPGDFLRAAMDEIGYTPPGERSEQ